jgi:diguanylate cyclase (GGDEF)-like protein
LTYQSPESRGRTWMEMTWTTLSGTGLALAFSFLLNYLLLFSESLTPSARSLIMAVALPIVIGAPLSFLLAYNLRRARLYRRRLTHMASHDEVTAVLKGRAFASLVDRRVSPRHGRPPPSGALLIVNVDNLNAINLSHGLEWGEEALRLIAATIRSSVRDDDIVGRLGPTEFGIFLAGATEENAREVGERIRADVAQVYFAPGRPAGADAADMLDVSVGGVMFRQELAFDAIYRAAEQRLSRAHGAGGMVIEHIPGPAAGSGGTAH